MARARKKSIKNLGIPVWSPTRLDHILRCPRKFFFGYQQGKNGNKKFQKSYPVTAPQARGIFLHRQVESDVFFKPDGSPKYKSAESYANAMGGRWIQVAKRKKIKGSEIDFGDNDPFLMKEVEIKPVCRAIYPILVEEGPPTLSEFPFSFVCQGNAFTGVIDSVRKDKDGNIVIRDFKSSFYGMSERDIDNMPQLTIYGLAFCVYAFMSYEFRDRFDLSESDVKTWGGNPTFIDDRLKFEIFSLYPEQPEGKARWALGYAIKRSNELGLEDMAYQLDELKQKFETETDKLGEVKIIHQTTRNDTHYQNLAELIELMNAMETYMIESGHYPAIRTDSCGRCKFDPVCLDYDQARGELGNRATQTQLFNPFAEFFKQLQAFKTEHRMEIYPSNPTKKTLPIEGQIQLF
jgi:hypothetical protein